MGLFFCLFYVVGTKNSQKKVILLCKCLLTASYKMVNITKIRPFFGLCLTHFFTPYKLITTFCKAGLMVIFISITTCQFFVGVENTFGTILYQTKPNFQTWNKHSFKHSNQTWFIFVFCLVLFFIYICTVQICLLVQYCFKHMVTDAKYLIIAWQCLIRFFNTYYEIT